jgi:hypothetical protein
MERGHRKGAGRGHGHRERREPVGRAHEERTREEKRQRGGTTPTEDVVRRGIEGEPGVEWHAGEDAGEVPEE